MPAVLGALGAGFGGTAGVPRSSPGKTRGLSTTPGGTVVLVCQGAHVGPAWGITCGRDPATRGSGAAEAAGTAYGVVTASVRPRALSVAPATVVVHGRRRARSRGVIAGKD
ncbi:hypothetical protein GCM10028802_23410 [Terrabacter terrigena]